MYVSDYISNVNNVVVAINSKIGETGSLDKKNALQVREDLRKHILRDAKHLTSTFKESYPLDVQIPSTVLTAVNDIGFKISNDLVALKERLSRVCERDEDKKKTTERINHILTHVSAFLEEVALKIETNNALISHGINNLEDVNAFTLEDEEPQRSTQNVIFPQLSGYELPAWGKSGNAE